MEDAPIVGSAGAECNHHRGSHLVDDFNPQQGQPSLERPGRQVAESQAVLPLLGCVGFEDRALVVECRVAVGQGEEVVGQMVWPVFVDDGVERFGEAQQFQTQGRSAG